MPQSVTTAVINDILSLLSNPIQYDPHLKESFPIEEDYLMVENNISSDYGIMKVSEVERNYPGGPPSATAKVSSIQTIPKPREERKLTEEEKERSYIALAQKQSTLRSALDET